jgi:hypothetical protein
MNVNVFFISKNIILQNDKNNHHHTTTTTTTNGITPLFGLLQPHLFSILKEHSP